MALTRLAASVLILVTTLSTAKAADLNSATVAGSKPTWSNLPGTDGRKHSLDDLEGQIVVVAITCNHCPLALEYFERLKEFSAKHDGSSRRVSLVAISLSNQETDKLPRMKELAEREGFNFAYLHDSSQQIGRALGATVTPQFFVLDQNRSIVYRGAWDDNVNQTKVKKRYVEDAVDALLAGKTPPVTQTKAVGCIIQYGK